MMEHTTWFCEGSVASEILKDKDNWGDLAPWQIAEVLGCSKKAVNSALLALRRKGIDVPYKKGRGKYRLTMADKDLIDGAGPISHGK